MEAHSPTPVAAPRVVSWTLVALLAIGSLALWIAVPIFGMWLASRLTDSFGWHMPLSLAIVIPGMFIVATGLAWLNSLYLRVNNAEAANVHGIAYRNRGPLEPMLVACFVLAIVALFVWFFVFAEGPSAQVI